MIYGTFFISAVLMSQVTAILVAISRMERLSFEARVYRHLRSATSEPFLRANFNDRHWAGRQESRR